jgi:hypothetical protein
VSRLKAPDEVDLPDRMPYIRSESVRQPEEAMTTKLTLRIDEKLIERAKSHAQRTGKSVSKMVEDYFELLPDPEQAEHRSLSPIVSSLQGILRNANVDVEGYRRHLEQKHR